MKNYSLLLKLIPLCILVQGCLAQKEIADYEIMDGVYSSRIFNGAKEKVYLDNEDEYLYILPLKEMDGGFEADTTKRNLLVYPQKRSQQLLKNARFYSSGIDVDLITIPFKYRSATGGVPPQLNTNFNANVYLGYRSEIYTLGYEENEINNLERYTRHYGVTVGLFSGIGGTAVNPFVTRDQVQLEYDGMVWSYGIAGSIGVNNLTLGLALGFDQLLDNNSEVWIYQKKPWLGLVLGINLN